MLTSGEQLSLCENIVHFLKYNLRRYEPALDEWVERTPYKKAKYTPALVEGEVYEDVSSPKVCKTWDELSLAFATPKIKRT